MTRAWPFQGRGEPEEPFHRPEDFVARRGPGIEAVVVRIGLHDAQLVLVDRSGRWERWVYESEAGAREAVERIGVTAHFGSYPEDLRVRMSSRVRDRQDLSRGPYPEQGRVGPVIPYPENRPRRLEDRAEGEPQG